VPGSRLRNHDAIVDHSLRLAGRLATAPPDAQVLVLGGDCSILVGIGVHLKRRGRFGLVHIDGHTDFRNPWNSQQCASLAGEDLAAVVGRHWASIADLEGLGPYFEPRDVVHVGCRPGDEEAQEVVRAGVTVVPAEAVNRDYGSARDTILGVIRRNGLDGYWLHLDVDVLDPSYVSAVDSPDPGGIDPSTLERLLTDLWSGCAGLNVTVFDPDLDPSGEQAKLLVEILGTGITGNAA
jgi:arginase